MAKFRLGKSIETQLREQRFGQYTDWRIKDETALCEAITRELHPDFLKEGYLTELYVRQVDRDDERYELWVRRVRKG